MWAGVESDTVVLSGRVLCEGGRKNDTDVPRGREPLSVWYARGKKCRRAWRENPAPRASPARLTAHLLDEERK